MSDEDRLRQTDQMEWLCPVCGHGLILESEIDDRGQALERDERWWECSQCNAIFESKPRTGEPDFDDPFMQRQIHEKRRERREDDSE